ncbi:MAG: ABC transporter permease subunit [Erysipelotrichaceae bacterium]
MNKTLFMQGWKSNYKFLIAFCAILTMYFSIMITMYDPKLESALSQFSKSLPEIMSMFGMMQTSATLIGFLSTYLYGMLMLVFPMIFTIMLAIRLISKQVDHGFMAYLLASPNSRLKVSITQMMVILSNLFVLILYCTLVGIIGCAFAFPNQLDTLAFLRLNVGVFILHVALAAIFYLVSCIFNEARNATFLASSIAVVFYLIQMLANMGGNLENFKYATIFTLFNSEQLIFGSNEAYYKLSILLLLAIICFGIGNLIFKKKDMPL